MDTKRCCTGQTPSELWIQVTKCLLQKKRTRSFQLKETNVSIGLDFPREKQENHLYFSLLRDSLNLLQRYWLQVFSETISRHSNGPNLMQYPVRKLLVGEFIFIEIVELIRVPVKFWPVQRLNLKNILTRWLVRWLIKIALCKFVKF